MNNQDKLSARKIIDTALVLNPNFSRFYYKLSQILETDRYDSSIYYMKIAIDVANKHENQPIYNTLNYKRWLAYYESFSNKYNVALNDFEYFQKESKKRGLPIDKNVLLQIILTNYNNHDFDYAKSLFKSSFSDEEKQVVKKFYPDQYSALISK